MKGLLFLGNKKKDFRWLSFIGLTVAFACVLSIYSYVEKELSYDSYHADADRIYRMSGQLIGAENTMDHAKLGQSMASGLLSEFPSIESVCRIRPCSEKLSFRLGEHLVTVEGAQFADPSLFRMLDFSFVYGSKDLALQNPNEVVINQTLSHKLFGIQNPVGKVLLCDGESTTIVGVIEDTPQNSHHKLDVLFTMPNLSSKSSDPIRISEKFWMPSVYTFLKLQESTSIDQLVETFPDFYKKNMASFGEAIKLSFQPEFIPLKELHYSHEMSYDQPKGNKSYSYILLCVALFILTIAIANYMIDLSFQINRIAKENSIHKVLGASNWELFYPFLIRNGLFITTAFACSLLLMVLILPLVLPQVQNNQISISVDQIVFGIAVIGVTLLTSLIAPFKRLFPSSTVSAFFEGKRGKGNQYNHVIIQIAVMVFLLISSIAVTKQLQFIMDRDKGYTADHIVTIALPQSIQNVSRDRIKQPFLSIPGVVAASFANHIPGEVLGSQAFVINKEGEEVTKIVNSMSFDSNYLSLMGMQLRAGANFDANSSTDQSNSILVNEAFMDYCGYDYSQVGELIENQVLLKGVVSDFAFQSLHNQIKPMLFTLNEEKNAYCYLKLQGGNSGISLENIESSWQSLFPNDAFSYSFLDQTVTQLYAADKMKETLVHLACYISILLLIMGFYNLSSQICGQRVKEIGIRKVNGAQSMDLIQLLNRFFIMRTVIAFVLACPIAYYAMSRWLEGFAYQTQLSWWIFALGSSIAMGVVFMAVGYQTIRAARRNPVESLKYE